MNRAFNLISSAYRSGCIRLLRYEVQVSVIAISFQLSVSSEELA
jgi:hypothetical protein